MGSELQRGLVGEIVARDRVEGGDYFNLIDIPREHAQLQVREFLRHASCAREVRELLVDVVGDLRNPESKPFLLTLLLEEPSDIWKTALHGLGILLDEGRMGTREALEAACARCRDRGDTERGEWIQEVLDHSVLPASS